MLQNRAKALFILKKIGLYKPAVFVVETSTLAFWIFFAALTNRNDRLLAKYLRSVNVHKLHIGCGPNYLNDWFNTDLYPNAYRTRLDCSKHFPFPDNSFDYILSEHMIEHVSYEKGRFLLSECFRVLKPNGVLRIVTPDLKFLISLYQDSNIQMNQDYIRWNAERFLSGTTPANATSVINNFYRDWGHRYIYDASVMKDALTKAGFTNLIESEIGISVHSELQGLEHTDRMPEGFLALESMVIEAQKQT